MTAPQPAYRVLQVRHLDERTFVLRFERREIRFEPGQYLSLGVRGTLAMRDYSIYSGMDDDYLEVLLREVPGGLVSGALARCRPGDELSLEGPYGLFVTTPAERAAARYLFVGTGTGISPFHCLAKSFPGMDYLLLHGVRSEREPFEYEAFDSRRLVRCTSRSTGGDYAGRVTDWLRARPVEPARLSYLCGNSDMIYEVFSILKDQGVRREQVRAEIYF